MAQKRKKGVNSIIFELDNDDVSSDEESAIKNKCSKNDSSELDGSFIVIDACSVDSEKDEVICLDTSLDVSVKKYENGDHSVGESVDSEVQVDSHLGSQGEMSPDYANNNECDTNTQSDGSLDVVVGCENRLPLLTIKFRDIHIAQRYKSVLARIVRDILRQVPENDSAELENDTDLELDIWPEDVDAVDGNSLDAEDDSLFIIDTEPNDGEIGTPAYCQKFHLLSDNVEEPVNNKSRFPRGQSCFNCSGSHSLRDCLLPKNYSAINERRKAMPARIGRYHVEDDQRYGHLLPGRISGNLRNALGLKRDELPMYMYRMRMLGYPPGWLEEARISHSGISMFDSKGKTVQDPDEEDGEICEAGSKDKFDIKKILDFPGFNVPASSKYKEEAHLYGCPPLSEQHSKLMMLQTLAPNAVKAYKRRKLTLVPRGSPTQLFMDEGHADMDLDDGHDISIDFPTVPPLPDDAPPMPPIDLPPPPPPLPPPEDIPPPPPEDVPPPPPEDIPPPPHTQLPAEPPLPPLPAEKTEVEGSDKGNGSEGNSVPECAVLNKVSSLQNEDSQSLTRSKSPSLADLEYRKKLLLEALANPKSPDTTEEIIVITTDPEEDLETIKLPDSMESPITPRKVNESLSETSSSAVMPTGHVKSSEYGTPVYNVASPFLKLPADLKFAKDICDVLNFENLPDSTGKYKKMSGLIKKVRNEVTRIQEN